MTGPAVHDGNVVLLPLSDVRQLGLVPQVVAEKLATTTDQSDQATKLQQEDAGSEETPRVRMKQMLAGGQS